MKRYYISDNTQPCGFIEVTEAEFYSIMGTEETAPYAGNLYRGEITIDDVPPELRDAVQSVVDAKIARWGTYENRNISDTEALNILTGGDDK